MRPRRPAFALLLLRAPHVVACAVLLAACAAPEQVAVTEVDRFDRGLPTAIGPIEVPPGPDVLRVCADPNNLPFSNKEGRGFENALAQLIAEDFNVTLATIWWPQRRGLVRNTLDAGRCDVVMGVPAGHAGTLNTRPYYQSTYVFMTRFGALAPPLVSLADARLARLKIGVHVIGDDLTSVPPAAALVQRGLAANLRGYSIYGDFAKPEPARDLVQALAQGTVDVAITFGPQAGWYARQSGLSLTVTEIDALEPGAPPMQFAIAMAVRKDDQALRDRLDAFIARRQADIVAVLRGYGVPLVATAAAPRAPAAPAAPQASLNN